MSTYTVQCTNIDKWAVHFYVRGIGILRHFHLEFLRLIYFKLFYIMSRFLEFQFKCPKNVHKPPFSGQKSGWLETGHVGYQTIQNFILILHCPKSNPNFRDITWNVEENEILHEIFRIVSRFHRYISCDFAEGGGKWQCTGIYTVRVHDKVTRVYSVILRTMYSTLLGTKTSVYVTGRVEQVHPQIWYEIL